MCVIRKIIIILNVLILTGCSYQAMNVAATAAHDASISKSDSIFVALPEKSSVMEQQLIVLLKEELCRSGLPFRIT